MSVTETGRDPHTKLRIICVGLDEVTAITDMLKHERKDLCLPGNKADGFENVFLICELEPIAHGGE
jgi:hypothetical protein